MCIPSLSVQRLAHQINEDCSFQFSEPCKLCMNSTRNSLYCVIFDAVVVQLSLRPTFTYSIWHTQRLQCRPTGSYHFRTMITGNLCLKKEVPRKFCTNLRQQSSKIDIGNCFKNCKLSEAYIQKIKERKKKQSISSI